MIRRPISRLALLFAATAAAPVALAQKPVPPTKPGTQKATPAQLAPVPTAGGFLGGSDDCATATPIAGTGMFPFDLTAATTGTEGQNEANCLAFATTGIDSDVWFDWSPGVTGNAVYETCGLTATDTKLAVYPGSGCPIDGTSLICNDDACGLQSSVSFAISSGSTYTLQLGTFPGAAAGTGTFRLDLLPPAPTNDDCSNPDVLPGDGTYSADLTQSTTGTQGQNETSCYAFGTSGIDNDVWYTWTAACSGTAELTTCGLTTTDTKVAAYPGIGCPVDGTSLACNDDSCGLQSTITFGVTGGTSYTLQVGTFPGAGTGTATFTIGVPGCTGGPGSAGCFGGTNCPCGNPGGADEGCRNSTGAGCSLDGSGTTNPDTVVLTATGAVPNQPGLFFQGDSDLAPGIPFGDGLRCAGTNVVRLSTIVPDASGCAASDASCGTPAGGSPGSISGHPAQPIPLVGSGLTRVYQFWYRDPVGGPCGTGFNLSNNYSITW